MFDKVRIKSSGKIGLLVGKTFSDDMVIRKGCAQPIPIYVVKTNEGELLEVKGEEDFENTE